MAQLITLTTTNTPFRPRWYYNAQGKCPLSPLIFIKLKNYVLQNSLYYLIISKLALQTFNNQIKIDFNKPFNIKTRTWQACVKGSSSIIGFKKAYTNRVKVRNVQLHPAYNRRKHSISHFNLINNQIKRLSKTFGYISSNKINAWIGLALAFAHNKRINNFTGSEQVSEYKGLLRQQLFRNSVDALNQVASPFQMLPAEVTSSAKLGAASRETKNQKQRMLFTTHAFEPRTIVNLVTLIESESCTTLWRNQYYASLNSARQALRHKRNRSHYALLINTNNHDLLVSDCSKPRSQKKSFLATQGLQVLNHGWLKAGDLFKTCL